MVDNERPICPHCGKPLFWQREDSDAGRLLCICGYSEWFFRNPQTTKEECAKIWGADLRFFNHSGGPKKTLRTFSCIICGESITREAYKKENLCKKPECKRQRQYRYNDRLVKPKKDVLEKFAEDGA